MNTLPIFIKLIRLAYFIKKMKKAICFFKKSYLFFNKNENDFRCFKYQQLVYLFYRYFSSFRMKKILNLVSCNLESKNCK